MPRPRASQDYDGPRWTSSEARAALSALSSSGLSVAAFAEREGLDAQRLYRWRRRFSGARGSVQGAPAFVEIRPSRLEPVEIVLRSGRVLRVSESISAPALERLVAVLERAPSC